MCPFCSGGICDCDDCEVFATREDAVRNAILGAKAVHPNDHDGDVYLCRCKDGRDGPCQDCYRVASGDRRSVDEIVSAWKSGN